jgi:hypothetical protein
LVQNPALFGKMQIRVAVFEDPNETEYTHAWGQVRKTKYTQEERRYYGPYWWPFYIDHTDQLNIKAGDFLVSYWVRPSGIKSKVVRVLPNSGSVWCMRGPELIRDAEGEEVSVILADETKEVRGLRFSDHEYKALESCIQDYFQGNAGKKFKGPIFINVELRDLRKKYLQIFRSLEKKLSKAP